METKPPRPYQVALQQELLTKLTTLFQPKPQHSARFTEYLRLCNDNPYEALYRLAILAEKPGRIPLSFGTLLDLDQADALSRAFWVYYGQALHQLMPARILERLYKFYGVA